MNTLNPSEMKAPADNSTPAVPNNTMPMTPPDSSKP